MATIQEETTSGNYSCPRLNESLKTVIFDPHGDLHLIIGQVECIFENISAFKCRTVSVKRDDQGQIVYHWNPIADQTNILDEPLVRHVDASTDTSIDANSTAGINIDNSSSKESSDDNSSSKEEEDDLDEELINKVTQELEHYHKMAYRFVVCSKALARASRFFNRLLFGGFSESQKPEGGEQWTVHLPHDNPTAMWHLMAIAHGNAHWIAPKKQVDLNELYELAVLCDKYDMTRLIALFSSSWIKAVWDHHKKATGVVTFSQILWISWVLGDKEIFKQSVDMLSSLCFSDGQGRLRYEGGWTWYTRMPPYPDLFSTTLEPPGAYGESPNHHTCCICSCTYDALHLRPNSQTTLGASRCLPIPLPWYRRTDVGRKRRIRVRLCSL